MWFTHARTYQDNHTHITFNSHFRYLIEETKQAFQFLSQEISLNLTHFVGCIIKAMQVTILFFIILSNID